MAKVHIPTVFIVVGLLAVALTIVMNVVIPRKSSRAAPARARVAVEVNTGEAADALLAGSTPTFVFVYADWCGFCKRADPIFTELSQSPTYQHVRMLKLNSAAAPAFVTKHGIRGYPAFLHNWGPKRGELVKVAGFQDKAAMQALLNSAPVASPTSAKVRLTVTHQDDVVRALNGTSPAVVFVSAEWCGFCKKLRPIWDEVVASGKFKHLTLLHIDAKDAPELIKTHGITGFPTLLSNRGSRKYVGYRPRDQLEQLLTSL